MDYDPQKASKLAKPDLPDLPRWIDNLEKFVDHIRVLAKQRIESGLCDPDDIEDFDAELSIDSPASQEMIDSTCAELKIELPNSYQAFLRTVSSGIRFHYCFILGADVPQDIPSCLCGGENPHYPDPIFSLENTSKWMKDAQDYASWSGISDFPEIQAVWMRSIPFFRHNNSDFLAFDPSCDANDPCIVLLDHEGEPKLVSPNLASFLIEWPRICYLGPTDYHHINAFFDLSNHVLSGDSNAAIELRRLIIWDPA